MGSEIKPLLVGMAETARILSVSRPTAYKLANRADFPAFMVGGRRMVSVEGLRKWIDDQVNGVGA